MGNQWHVKINEEVVGPLTSKQLREMVAAGDINPETEIQKNDSRWVQAVEVNGLFEAAGRKPVDYVCPHCHSEMAKPPAECPECGEFVEDAYVERNQDDLHRPIAKNDKPDPLDKIRNVWKEMLDRIRRLGH